MGFGLRGLEFREFLRGLSFKVAYNYIFHHEDEIFLKGTCYSREIANTSNALLDWTIHNFIFMLSTDYKNDYCVGPRMSLFCRIPFNGRRSIQASVIGAEIDYSF